MEEICGDGMWTLLATLHAYSGVWEGEHGGYGGGEGPSTTNEVGNMEGETIEHGNVESSIHELRQSGVAD